MAAFFWGAAPRDARQSIYDLNPPAVADPPMQRKSYIVNPKSPGLPYHCPAQITRAADGTDGDSIGAYAVQVGIHLVRGENLCVPTSLGQTLQYP